MSKDWSPEELAQASAAMKANGCMSFEEMITAVEINGLQCFYYTFGSDEKFPYRNGWVIVLARDWQDAHQKFSARLPDRRENTLNCAFFYDAEKWRTMDQENNWHGWKCHAIIT